ncbi:MAG: DUF3945 domain-containing protein [Rikenellaceae bacterium]|jgi:hypothetical protein|nr:DUF3945 domain-containing protein [Rikenellaceae bacterium]
MAKQTDNNVVPSLSTAPPGGGFDDNRTGAVVSSSVDPSDDILDDVRQTSSPDDELPEIALIVDRDLRSVVAVSEVDGNGRVETIPQEEVMSRLSEANRNRNGGSNGNNVSDVNDGGKGDVSNGNNVVDKGDGGGNDDNEHSDGAGDGNDDRGNGEDNGNDNSDDKDRNRKNNDIRPPNEQRNEFLKSGRDGSVWDLVKNFVTNLSSQAGNPTRFGLLRLSTKDFLEMIEAIRDYAAGINSAEARALWRNFVFGEEGREEGRGRRQSRTRPSTSSQPASQTERQDRSRSDQHDRPRTGIQSQTHTNRQSQTINQPNINLKTSKDMAKQEKASKDEAGQFVPGASPEERAAKAQADAGQTQPDGRKYRYIETMIDWEQLKRYGLTRDRIPQEELDNMMTGRRTSKLFPVIMSASGVTARTQAKLSFITGEDGRPQLIVHGVKKEPTFDKPYHGHVFTPEDKKNLLEEGNMGRMVELNYNGQLVPAFISLDRLTNDIVSMRADTLHIPDEICGAKLSDYDRIDLAEGRKVFLEGLVGKSGREFDAHIQFNAERRGLEYIFPKGDVKNATKLGGVELSPEQRKELAAGKAILVENMTAKSGNLYTSYVKYDETTDKLQYTRYNPDVPGEFHVPKVLNGVELTGEDREDLRHGRHVYVEGMVSRSGEEYSGYVRFDAEGNYRTARTIEGLDEERQVKLPAEVYGKTLSADERAQLYEGKIVHLTGLKGNDGAEFDRYARLNSQTGRLDYYAQDPAQRRAATQGAGQKSSADGKTGQGQGAAAKPTQSGKPKQSSQNPTQKPGFFRKPAVPKM